jgi:hypothetical protein
MRLKTPKRSLLSDLALDANKKNLPKRQSPRSEKMSGFEQVFSSSSPLELITLRQGMSAQAWTVDKNKETRNGDQPKYQLDTQSKGGAL